jgi:hypothetical protein
LPVITNNQPFILDLYTLPHLIISTLHLYLIIYPQTLNREPTLVPSRPNQQPTLTSTLTFSLQIITRSQTNSSKSKHFLDYHFYHSTKHPPQALFTNILPFEPTTFKQVARDHDWLNAMTAKYNALLANNTWSLYPRPSCEEQMSFFFFINKTTI